jgi:hypothetical protein
VVHLVPWALPGGRVTAVATPLAMDTLDVAAVYLDGLEVATAVQVVLAAFGGEVIRLERRWGVAP